MAESKGGIRIFGRGKSRMKATLILILAFFTPSMAQAALYGPKIDLAHSPYNYCARINDSATELLCWGGRETSGSKIPAFRSLTGFDAGTGQVCALDSGEVKCWGGRAEEYAKAFEKIRALQVKASHDLTCVLDSTSVTCAGFWRHEKRVFENLVNPRMISASPQAVCVIDDLGLRCKGEWGTPYNENRNQRYGLIPQPELKNPTFVSNSSDRICAIDEEGLKCWDFNQACDNPYSKPGQFTCKGSTGLGIPKGGEKWPVVPGFLRPTKVSAYENQSCVLEAGELKCWSCEFHESRSLPTNWKDCALTPLRPLVKVSEGESFQFGVGAYGSRFDPTCSIDEEGLKCPEVKQANGVAMPQKLKTFRPYSDDLTFPLSRAGKFMALLAAGSAPIKAQLLGRLSGIFQADLASSDRTTEQNLARYLFLKLHERAFLSGDSPYYLEKVIPAYLQSVAEIEADLALRGVDGIPASALNRRVVLKAVQANLAVAMEVLPLADRASLTDVMRALGQAIENPLDGGRIQAVVAGLASNRSITDKLRGSSKAAFLPQILQQAAEWLEKAK